MARETLTNYFPHLLLHLWRSLLQLDQLVSLKGLFVHKVLPAAIGPLACVAPLVHREVLLPGEALPTLGVD